MDRSQEIDHSRNQLPHWHQTNCVQFVTWSLGDALPKKALRRLYCQKEMWLKHHPQPWDDETQQEYYERFEHRLNRWLDCGHGSCGLRFEEARELVCSTLHHFEDERTHLYAYAIMTNHVHVLFSVMEPWNISSVMHSWKSYTAHQLRNRFGFRSRVWMKDYWDRMIRSEAHFWKVQRYILENPEKAGFSERSTTVWCRGD